MVPPASPKSSKSHPDTFRIHIQNPPEDPASLRLGKATLLAALKSRRALGAQKFAVTEDDGGEELPAGLDEIQAMVTLAKIDLAEAGKRAPKLKWVQTTFAGMEGMLEDVPHGLKVTNASGVHAEKGGEFILAAALMLAYQIPQFIADKETREWTPLFGPTLKERRVTILGVGAIGASASKHLRERGCHVTGVTRSGRAKTKLDRNATLRDLDDVLRKTDILVSTLPATPDTEGLIDRQRIDLLPDGAGIVVVGRAAPLDYEAIMDRLDADTLRGAVLDVFPEEPIPKRHRAWKTPRLVITPHCSVDDHTVYIERCLEIFLDNLERHLAGRKLKNLVDTGKGY